MPGHVGELGQGNRTRLPKGARLFAASPAPTTKGIGFRFFSQLQIFVHCSVCLSCVSPSLGVLDFSDFFQLLMICEKKQRVLGEAVHPHVQCFQGIA